MASGAGERRASKNAELERELQGAIAMMENHPAQTTGFEAPEPATESGSPPPIEMSSAGCTRAQGAAGMLAAELLDAVDSGSSAALLGVLSRIARMDLGIGNAKGMDAADDAELERLELLRAIAVQMRLDLHAMLMHIYQRIETSRSYLDIARHLAGRAPGEGADLGAALPRLGLEEGATPGGREIDAGGRNGEI
ncbi:MAG: hypothetical protein IT170_05090 [Bryobacterales bacterium]|nr:hypothetical protein [Bryobacterales bacterium]